MLRIALLLVLLLAGSVWAADSTQHVTKQSQSTNSQSDLRQQSGIPHSGDASPVNPNRSSNTSEHETQKESDADWWLAKFTGLLVVVGLAQAGLFLWQLLVMRSGIKDATTAANAATTSANASKKSADIAEETMIASRRAFVFPRGISYLVWDDPKKADSYIWRFKIDWFNYGETPTKNLSLFIESTLVSKKLADNFDFESISKYDAAHTVTGLLPPKVSLQGGQVPFVETEDALTTQDLADIRDGNKLFYIWGWAKYLDIFSPRTNPHITKFCWVLCVNSDPRKFKPLSSVSGETPSFGYFLHPQGNCADEECNQHSA